MKVLVLAAILLLSQGIQSQESVPLEPLKKLNDVVTSRLRKGLQEARRGDCSMTLLQLQQAVELPLSQLAHKIEALNAFNLPRRDVGSIGSSSIRNGTLSGEGAALRQGATPTNKDFQKKVLQILRRLGIYDNFTTRVFNAIFSDEKQLRKLKKKLDDLGKEDKSADQDLWNFVIDLY
ncbi:hypothetical protein KR084_010937 [Drosophila pseudotakahashii]|nr:hypothetical protein KR084_010937 [Drosophila pseudotakahashii]